MRSTKTWLSIALATAVIGAGGAGVAFASSTTDHGTDDVAAVSSATATPASVPDDSSTRTPAPVAPSPVAPSPVAPSPVAPSPTATPAPSTAPATTPAPVPVPDLGLAETRAVLAVGGGTVVSSERSGSSNHAYEVRVRRADGSVVEVKLDAAFAVIRIDDDSATDDHGDDSASGSDRNGHGHGDDDGADDHGGHGHGSDD